MAKKQEEIFTIDGDDFYTPYETKCVGCKYFNLIDRNCIAFPDGIPQEFDSGRKKHDRVTPGQVGLTVFTPLS